MLAAYRGRGGAALAHGNRGRRSHNAVAPAAVELAIHLYEGVNHTDLPELLSEREVIDLSWPTVQRILTKVGIGSPRVWRSPHRRQCGGPTPPGPSGTTLVVEGQIQRLSRPTGTFSLCLSYSTACLKPKVSRC